MGGYLYSKWTVGQVDSVERSKDGIVRRAVVRYYNANENVPRFSPRCVRSLCRLFNIEDNYWVNDMAKSEMLVKDLMQKEKKVPPMKLVKQGDGFVVASNCQRSCNCCCRGHCSLAKDYHSKNGKVSGVNLAKLDVKLEKDELEFPFLFEKDLDEEDAYLSMYGSSKSNLEFNDPLYETLVAMETNFSMEN